LLCRDGILNFRRAICLLHTNIKTKIYIELGIFLFIEVCHHPKGRTYRLKMLGNTMLRNSSELKTKEVSGLWVNLHNEKLKGM